MQTPTPKEIEREVAALKDIRRRSTQQGPGSIPLDPDLPPNGVASASAGGYWDNYSNDQLRAASVSPDNSGSAEQPDDGSDDPSHLFWVPAHLHPEIAPAEFRAFLKEHTTATPDDGALLARTMSSSSTLARASSGLGRKKSMLSKQYNPKLGDRVEDENVVTVKRNRSSIYSTAGPQLTIGDLQKLEQLAEEAAMSDDPSKLRSVLRRSLSLNVAPSFIDQMDGVPEEDDADAPIIVPRPGQILRRSARTKIRKVGLPGDGGGHRFAATRRGTRTAKPNIDITSDSGHESSPRQSLEQQRDGDERPLSYADEAFILDAYGDRRDSMTSNASSAEDDDLTSAASHSSAPTSVPQSSSHGGTVGQRPISPPIDASSLSPPRGQTVRRVSPPPSLQNQQPEYHQQQSDYQQPQPVLHHPTPQRHLEVPQQQGSSRTPSPSNESGKSKQSTSPDPFRRSPSAPPQSTTTPSGSAMGQSPSVSPAPSIRSNKSTKEKEKKGLLKGMWGGEKKKEKASEAANKEREGSKDGGFFGSLFGGGKKKHEEPEPQGRGLLAGAGPAAAAALLGASKTKNQPSPPSPGLQASFSRYPIHVERAVYRLSHIKLANPRRPLYEQVLISNLMFWYLGVINKVTPPTPAAGSEAASTGAATGADANGTTLSKEEKEKADKEKAEKEKAEREERERVEKERLEKEKEREAKERERDRGDKEKEVKKRGTLVKNVPPGSGPGGGRRAEMPVRGPQYDVQHRIMEQEGNAGGYHHPPPGRHQGGRPQEQQPYMDGRGPPPPRGPHHGPPQHHQQSYAGQPPYPPQPYQQQSPPPPGTTNYMQFAPALPPGAMAPPVGQEPWMGSSSSSRDSPYAAAAPGPGMMGGGPGRSKSPPSRGPPPVSPPPGGARLVQRSTSANAGGPPPPQPLVGQGRPPPPTQQRGGPPPIATNVNGGWGPPSPQRRGPSPQPPPAGARRPRTAESDDPERSLEWQQQPQRGGPVVR